MLSSTLRALGETLTFAPARRTLATRRPVTAINSAAPGVYRTPVEPATVDTEVKKSRFVATCAPCTSADDALAFIRDHADLTASHNCWAFRTGESVYRFSDDGEPGGSAGAPIMNAVNASGLDFVVCVVTRYYGGTQLGVGGLIRAYGGAAQLALEKATETAVEVTPKVDCAVNCAASDLGGVYLALDEFKAVTIDEEFSDDGTVHLQVEVELASVDDLQNRVQNATSGRAEFKWWPPVEQ